ncbi:MAG: hypothetical protein F7C35_06500 [Desulfurococcales archaeon]|nr:hypothetical protein [Desulfurococcales archaeon]
MNDKVRAGLIAVAFLIIAAGIPASIISSQASLASMTKSYLDVINPIVEVAIQELEPFPNETLQQALSNVTLIANNIYEKAYNDTIFADRGELLYIKVGTFITYKSEECFSSSTGPTGPVKDTIEISLNRSGVAIPFRFSPGITIRDPANFSRYCPVYYFSLLATAPLRGDQSWYYISGASIPNNSDNNGPVKVLAFKPLAYAMNWKAGDTVNLSGVEIKIIGFFDYKKNIQSITAISPPALITDENGLTRLIDDVAESVLHVAKAQDTNKVLSYAVVDTMGVLNTGSTDVMVKELEMESGKPVFVPSLYPLRYKPYKDSISALINESSNNTALTIFKSNIIKPTFGVIVYYDANHSLMDIFKRARERGENDLDVVMNLANQISNQVSSAVPQRFLTYTIISTQYGFPMAYETISPPPEGSEGFSGARYQVSIKTKFEDLPQMTGVIFNNPMAGISFITVSLGFIVAGYYATKHVVEIAVSDLRPFLASIIARGASQKRMKRWLGLSILLLALLSGIVGLILSVYSVGGFYRMQLSGLIPPPRSLLANNIIIISTLLVVLIIFALVYRSVLKQIEEIRPQEAIRPVESMFRAPPASKKGRVAIGGLSAAILFSTLVVMVAGNIDEFLNRLNEYGTLVVALGFVVALIGFVGMPFAPLLAVVSLSRLAAVWSAPYRAAVSLAKKVAGRLKSPVSISASTLSSRIESLVGASVISLSLALGALIAHYNYLWLEHKLYEVQSYLYAPGSPYDVSQILLTGSSASAVAGEMKVLSAFSAFIGLIAVYTLFASTYKLIESEVVVMRVRGASRGDAIRFVYGMLLPSVISIFVVALIGGLAMWVYTLAPARLTLAYLSSDESSMLASIIPGLKDIILAPVHMVEPWLVMAALLGVLLVVPVLVSYGTVRGRNLASLLRRRVMG